MKISLLFAAVPLLVSCATAPRTAPLVDYHQHLVSAAFEPIVKMPARDGAALVRELDAAGIERAVVLSVGYSFGDERKALPDPDRLTREENDWTSAQVTRNAPRLIGFCSANPLRPAALEELDRCLQLPGMTGIKVHLGNAGISLRDPAQLARTRQLFALAERHRAPVLVHMRPRGGNDYGARWWPGGSGKSASGGSSTAPTSACRAARSPAAGRFSERNSPSAPRSCNRSWGTRRDSPGDWATWLEPAFRMTA